MQSSCIRASGQVCATDYRNTQLAYCPSKPVSRRLSSCKINDPGFEKSGKNRVTSFKYVQIIPSPVVGSGVDVLHTTPVP